MLSPSDINIPVTICGESQGINKLAQATRSAIQQMANGSGTLFRFKLTEALIAGSHAAADIESWDGTAYTRQRDGTVYDEEPGGAWSGPIGDEGWCTGRDDTSGQFSIILMAPKHDASTIQQSYTNLFDELAPSSPIVQWSSASLKETTSPFVFKTTDFGSLAFARQFGPFTTTGNVVASEAGIIHDPTVVAPSVTGNFTVLTEGTYRVSWRASAILGNGVSAAADGWAYAQYRIRGIGGALPSGFPQIILNFDRPTANNYDNVFKTNSQTVYYPMQAGDKFYVEAGAFSNAVTFTPQFGIGFDQILSIQKVGPYLAF